MSLIRMQEQTVTNTPVPEQPRAVSIHLRSGNATQRSLRMVTVFAGMLAALAILSLIHI